MPDPYGNPGYTYPNDLVSDTYDSGAALDLCGGHTAGGMLSMHYHAVTEACFERDAQARPANTYTAATSDFNIQAALEDECDRESSIVGWPMVTPSKGPAFA